VSAALLPPPAFAAVSVRGLWHQFGATTALAGLSFEVPPGSCFGVVGPNGSGKTTTFRILCGLLQPANGSASIDGIDVIADPIEVRRRIGVVLDPLALFERLSAREMLTTLADLRGLDPAEARPRADGLFHALGLDDAVDRPISGYSHGMRKKTALAGALLHRPAVLILDEPFEGVDPVSAQTMKAMLDQYRRGGGTVVLSSHVMDLVERLCDHVAVVHNGVLLASGRTEAIRQGRPLGDVFVEVIGADTSLGADLDWLHES
jgi:ABC-2 type transport system ATP-binding protein